MPRPRRGRTSARRRCPSREGGGGPGAHGAPTHTHVLRVCAFLVNPESGFDFCFRIAFLQQATTA